MQEIIGFYDCDPCNVNAVFIKAYWKTQFVIVMGLKLQRMGFCRPASGVERLYLEGKFKS